MPLAALISYSGAYGGAERVLIDFAQALDGERVLLCPPGPLAQVAAGHGIRVLPLRRRRLELRASLADRVLAPARLAGHAVEVRRIVRDLDPDLAVVCGMRSAMALLLGFRGATPVIFDHHDFLPGGAIGALVRGAARRADLVVVPSAAIAEELAPGPRVQVVHPGIEVASFANDEVVVDPPRLLLLGALVPWKRPDLAVEVLALARAVLPELRLRIVGETIADVDAELPRALHTRALALGVADAVDFGGAVADVREELVQASCLLHCAPREPFGLVLVEALAAGRPVIAPDAGGPAEIVDPSCGVLYPAGDAAEAAAAVVALLRDPERARTLGSAGRARAAAKFDSSRARAEFAAAAAGVARRSSRAPGADPPAVLTVTRNSAERLPGLLDSVKRFLPGAQVVVVDCASSDGSVALARTAGAEVIELRENVGFGRACNLGLRAVQAPVSALLNPDVELVDASLLGLAGIAASERRLFAPLVLSPDGSRQDTAHVRPASPAALLGAALPQRLPILAPWRARRARRIGWAVGCALVAQTELLRELGPFDQSIFLYGEDLELGLHAAQCGIETWFWPGARVVHHQAHSSRLEFGGEPYERLARARRDVIGRRLGERSARLDDLAQALGFTLRATVRRLLGRGGEREQRQLRALRDARRPR